MSSTPGHCCLGISEEHCHLPHYVKGSTGTKTLLTQGRKVWGLWARGIKIVVIYFRPGRKAAYTWYRNKKQDSVRIRLNEFIAPVDTTEGAGRIPIPTPHTHHREDKNQPKPPSSDCLVEESRHWAVNRQRRVMRHKDKWVRTRKLSSLSRIISGLGKSQCSFSLLATWNNPGSPEKSKATWVRKIWAAMGQATWISWNSFATSFTTGFWGN